MKIDEINDWLQVAGLLGVIASLMFVGYEIHQSREIAMAEMYQNRAASMLQIFHAEATDKSSWKALEKSRREEQLTRWEKVQVDRYHAMYFTHWENNHFLLQKGLMDQEQWDASLKSIKNVVEIGGLQDWWKNARDGYRASFAKVVDEAIQNSNQKHKNGNGS